VIASAREALAAVAALAVYRTAVVPRVTEELACWREAAAAISAPAARALALAAIDEKGLNVEAVSVFAILAPRRGRATAIRAIVALQVAIDYLDSLGEARSEGDSTYLEQLFRAYEANARALPSHAAVAPLLQASVERCGEGQAATHAAEHGDPAALESWASARRAPAVYRWWEVGAGASSSVAAHALVAAAADPATTPADAELLDAAYFPSIGALTVLLDDLVDREEDAAAGAHNYLAYYRDGEQAADRLDLIAQLARAAIAPLRHPRRHAAILAGVVGFYLSAAAAQAPAARPVRDRLLRSGGPAVRAIAAFMRTRRRLSP
jgi:hypothetical protein